VKIIKTVSGFKSWRRQQGFTHSIGFVPTMGALHEGHLDLGRRARKSNKATVVSIFVNPTQFGPNEDFKQYPRPWNRDLSLLRDLAVDILFAPSSQEMYPAAPQTTVSVKDLNNVLCGAPTSRGPGHFDGVATVVAKLFNIIEPTRAYFGLKDFQQVRVIEQMVADLNFPVQIIRCPTVRAKSGLALSSRNAYLNKDEQLVAPRFYAALQYGRKLLTSKSKMTPQQIRNQVKGQLTSNPQIKVEYVELVDPKTLQPLTTRQRPALLVSAIRLGKTRLIDNLLII
jgi:pantoate--beta-alanine ligase